MSRARKGSGEKRVQESVSKDKEGRKDGSASQICTKIAVMVSNEGETGSFRSTTEINGQNYMNTKNLNFIPYNDQV